MLEQALTCPAELGKFRLLERIGGGWTSEVYKACLVIADKGEIQSAREPKVFVIKVPVDKSESSPLRRELWKRHALDAEKLHKFFKRELDLLTSCRGHPNIIYLWPELSDPALTDGHPVIVTELGCLDVGMLVDAFPSKGLPIDCIKYVAAQAASACRYLHEKGFTWLDPRLVNIVITQNFVCKIIDFAMDWDFPKERDSLYFGAFLLYEPLTGQAVDVDPTLDDIRSFKQVLGDHPTLDAEARGLTYRMLEGGSMEMACKHSWLVGTDGGDVSIDEIILQRLRKEAWHSLPVEAVAFLRDRGVVPADLTRTD